MNTVVHSMRNHLRIDGERTVLQKLALLLSRRQVSNDNWWIRLFTVLLPTMFLSAVVFQPWVDPKWMFLDPLTAAELSGDCCHSHYGFVSTAGVILWASTAAVALFTALVLIMMRTKTEIVFFPLLCGLLTGWIALDDAFLLHETVLPAFGVPQNAIIATYVMLALFYFAFNLRQIFKRDFWLLVMGAGALATSIAVDVIFHSLNPMLVLLEDSAKFFGIFCWASFHMTSFAALLKEHNEGQTNE